MKMPHGWSGFLQHLALASGLAFASHAAVAVGPGPEVCAACHQAPSASYAASVHGQKGNLRGPSNAGECSTCHGDATEHVKAGGGKGVGGIKGFNNKAISAEEKSGICLACHDTTRALTFWSSGRHKKNDVSCNNCHTLHESKNGPPLRADNPSISPLVTTGRQLEYETCTACHKQIRAQLTKPSHHPIIEGKVKCSSCHNPHGALSHAMIKEESVNQLCTGCHTDKRGPYLQEHPPVEENCLTCHNSHGSQHMKLLAERVPNVCQDCHDWSRHPGTYYSGNQGFNFTAPATAANTRLIARGCVNCHNSIHGSNAPGNRGKFMTR